MNKSKIIICGAGIAGVACAYYLSKQQSEKNGNVEILLIDKLHPLSLTTSMSGENFREYWPQHCLHEFSSHSINLMEKLQHEHPNEFAMKYYGYDFISRNKGEHIFQTDYDQNNSGFTLIDDEEKIKSQYPYLDSSIKQIVKLHRAGGFDVYALGSLMLKLARKNGVQFIQGEITDIKKNKENYQVSLGNDIYETQKLVLSGGPFTKMLAQFLDIKLPIYSISQRKFVIPDPANLIPRDMPFTIYADKQKLNWSDDELEMISSDEKYNYLLDEFPAGLHIKPEGQNQIKIGWAFNRKPESPKWDLADDPEFPDVVLRGATRFIPSLEQYLDVIPTPVVQFSGYYTRTKENLPLIGNLDENLFVVTALAGYGTMTACAAGELCTSYINQLDLPDYARYFAPARYDDEALMQEIKSVNSDGQL